MCGRYYVSIEEQELRDIIAEIEREHGAPEVNTGEIRPTNIAPVLTYVNGQIKPQAMLWGFPKWGEQKGVIFNARAETVLEKNMFRRSILERPVLIPTSGFFEWKAVSDRSAKEKYLFTDPKESILYLAGFYNTFADKDGPVKERFTILTTAANDSMLPYHNRMPVLLRRSETEAWLQGNELSQFLERIPFALRATAT